MPALAWCFGGQNRARQCPEETESICAVVELTAATRGSGWSHLDEAARGGGVSSEWVGERRNRRWSASVVEAKGRSCSAQRGECQAEAAASARRCNGLGFENSVFLDRSLEFSYLSVHVSSRPSVLSFRVPTSLPLLLIDHWNQQSIVLTPPTTTKESARHSLRQQRRQLHAPSAALPVPHINLR